MKYKASLEPGKVAVVTGGSSGIGKAIAVLLVEKGMDVWLVAQRKELLEAARIELEDHRINPNQAIRAASADISDLDQVRGIVRQVTETSGAPDLLVNSAGVTHPGYVQELDIEIFRWMMEVNYFGSVYMIKEFLPGMIGRGSGYILNVSSGAGYIGYFGYTAYSASKFAVRGFTQALQQEMKFCGIGVSILYPPDTDTPQLAYEYHFKPDETRALSSFGGLMAPETVAHETIKGIERGQYVILPGFESKVFYRLALFSETLANYLIHQIISSVYKKKKSTPSEEA